MTLSAYEELVFAELEAQFHSGESPREDPDPHDPDPPHPPYLTLSVAGVVVGAILLAAAHYRELLIGISNLFGFAPPSITSALRLAGFAVLLVAAFLLGRRQAVGRGNEEVAPVR